MFNPPQSSNTHGKMGAFMSECEEDIGNEAIIDEFYKKDKETTGFTGREFRL